MIGAGGIGLSGLDLGAPSLPTVVTGYRVSPPQWPAGLTLRLVALADLHACRPRMGPERIRAIVDQANALDADVVTLLGDYVIGHEKLTGAVAASEWAGELGRLRAPLGVHAVLGNHDWWEDNAAQRRGGGPVASRLALERVGILVHENDAIRLRKAGRPFWLAGLGSQLALMTSRLASDAPALARAGGRSLIGVDDLDGTLARIDDGDPVILMAHEPDIFAKVPARVALTLAGHTHGVAARALKVSPLARLSSLARRSPIVPARFADRYTYGHVVEEDRHLIISGGLGTSAVPHRTGVAPEIVVVEVGA